MHEAWGTIGKGEQVKLTYTTQENETETNTAPIIAKKKKKRKTTKRNISRYTVTNGRMTKEQEDSKKELDR